MKTLIYVLLILQMLASFVLAKEGLEYGGIILKGQNVQYKDGYDGDDKALAGRNHYETARSYLTGFYHFNDNNKIRLTLDSSTYGQTDSAAFGGPFANTYKSSNWVFVKYLYLDSKNTFGFDNIKVGQFETPWVDYEEKLWGKRFIVASLLEAHGITSAADRGVSLKKKLGENGEYEIAVIGGEGYIYKDISNRFDNIEGRYSHKLTDKISVAVGGGSGSKLTKGEWLTLSDQDSDALKHHEFFVGNISYIAKSDLRLTYTIYNSLDSNEMGKDKRTLTRAFGNSASIVKSIEQIKGLDVVARLDNKDTDIYLGGNAMQKSLVGVAYEVNSNMNIAYSSQAATYEDRRDLTDHADYLQVQITM